MAVNVMPVTISIAEMMWPYSVTGAIMPYPTVARVSMLKKNASLNDPGRVLVMSPAPRT